MKIVFICGSLEPGRDGVGDYVRRLGIALQEQGNIIRAIALNDYYTDVEQSECQQTTSGTLIILRLPAIQNLQWRFTRAKQWIDNFNPDWLSLQFVPYAFQKRGIPFNLVHYLVKLGENRHWHIMIHELWIGMSTESSIKHVLLSKVQRFTIKRLVNRLHPEVINTHTSLYQAHLTKLGFTSQYLPLFSNIPNIVKPPLFYTTEITLPAVSDSVSLVLFGFIHPGAPVELLAHDVAQFANRSQVSVSLIMVGRCGNEQERWANSWTAVGLPVRILGEQSPEVISQILQESTIGIVTTPALLLGKSGTAAAMREHGLLTLCVCAPWHPRDINNLESLDDTLIYQKGKFETYLAKKPSEKIIQLPDVARQLNDSLLASM